MVTETFRDSLPDARIVAVSQHRIVNDGKQPAEEVTWKSKTVYSKKDTLNFDSFAQQVPPYRISLMAGGSLDIPPLTIPEMTGEITDLNTFYVAASAKMHMQNLSKKLTYFKDSVLYGKFADSVQILTGEDKIQVSQKLIRQDKKTSTVETSFLPPDELGITPLLDTIRRRTFDHPNNFQMVRKAAVDKVNLIWGVEQFVITSEIENATGKIIKATMVNTLNLRMRFNATTDLKLYQGEIPLTIKRIITIQKIDDR